MLSGENIICLWFNVSYLAKCSFDKSLAVIDKGAEFARASLQILGAFRPSYHSYMSRYFSGTRWLLVNLKYSSPRNFTNPTIDVILCRYRTSGTVRMDHASFPFRFPWWTVFYPRHPPSNYLVYVRWQDSLISILFLFYLYSISSLPLVYLCSIYILFLFHFYSISIRFLFYSYSVYSISILFWFYINSISIFNAIF
jgi:hypothetical protein